MRKIFCIFLVSVSLNTGASDGAENPDISTSALILESDLYRPTNSLSISNNKKGALEEAKIAIGTILRSHHFNKYDYHDYNETHNGVYININRWSTGTYVNSSDEQSVFVTYNPSLYLKGPLEINFVAGISNGYEGWEYAQGDYLPILGVSAQWMYLKTMLSYDALAFGLELPLN